MAFLRSTVCVPSGRGEFGTMSPLESTVSGADTNLPAMHWWQLMNCFVVVIPYFCVTIESRQNFNRRQKSLSTWQRCSVGERGDLEMRGQEEGGGSLQKEISSSELFDQC